MKSVLLSILMLLQVINLISQTQEPDKKPKLGDKYGGGIIFYIDQTGEHGLITAPFDQATNVRWEDDWGLMLAGANSLDDGNYNTKKIIKEHKKPEKTAAYICDTLSLGGYNDWYLPALNELKDVYNKQNLIRGFIVGDYCSSTEASQTDCWNVHFKPHRRIEFHYAKTRKIYNIRCIRKF